MPTSPRHAAVALATLATLAAGAGGDARAQPAPPAAEEGAGDPAIDPAALDAGEANLESTADRQGMIFTSALGAAFSVGIGMPNATGQGGAITLRMGRVASPRSVVGVELVGNALFADVDGSEAGSLYRTDATNLLVFGQYYAKRALWLRLGLGAGRYAGERYAVTGPDMSEILVRPRRRLAGPAGSLGAGVDVLRVKRFRMSLEFSATSLLNRDGVVLSNAFLLGLTYD